jgi:hypothetical protein
MNTYFTINAIRFPFESLSSAVVGFTINQIAFPITSSDPGSGSVVCGTYAINPTVNATITIEVC